VVDVAGMYRRFGVRVPPLGDGWASVRCFSGRHEDRHPSARVHLTSGGFRCFTCHARGGALDALELLGVPDRTEAARIAVEYGVLEPVQAKRRRRPLPSLGASSAGRPDRDLDHDRDHADTGVVGIGGTVDYDALPAGPGVRLERSWVYVDEHGVPVGRVRRFDLENGEKRIWAERPDGDGWTPGLAGTVLPLYRLPEVRERARRGEPVLLVEGEKAVDALDRLGIFATTNPGGALKWRPEHTAALAGATVLAIADCDLAGREHAIQVSSELLATGIRVLDPLDLDELAHDGFDVVDYLAELAATIRAVTPEVLERDLRTRLRDHLERELWRQLPADTTRLSRRLELVRFRADGGDRQALLVCERCGCERVHLLRAGLAYCACGDHRLAPS
jgi:hypothetical protein